MDVIDHLLAISARIDGCGALIKAFYKEDDLSPSCQNAIYSIVVLLNAINQNLGNVIVDMEAQSWMN